MNLKLPANVEVKEVTRKSVGQKTRTFVVFRGGNDIGLITKQRDTRTDWFPYQAFAPQVSMSEPRKLTGNFFASRLGFPDSDEGYAPVRSAKNPMQAALDLIVSR